MDKSLISNFRTIFIRTIKNLLIMQNYEEQGQSDALAFEKDMNEILDLAEEALNRQWIPIKMRPGTDEEYEAFSQYGECPREGFRVFDCQMPDDGQEVLVTTRWGYVCIDTWYRDVDCCYFENNSDDDDVIAWMPIPAAYKSEVQDADN